MDEHGTMFGPLKTHKNSYINIMNHNHNSTPLIHATFPNRDTIFIQMRLNLCKVSSFRDELMQGWRVLTNTFWKDVGSTCDWQEWKGFRSQFAVAAAQEKKKEEETQCLWKVLLVKGIRLQLWLCQLGKCHNSQRLYLHVLESLKRTEENAEKYQPCTCI